MAYHVVYEMTAKPGAGKALGAALNGLKTAVLALPNAQSVEILAALDNPDAYLFHEVWPSKQGYDEGAQHLPKSAFAPLKELLGAPPARKEYAPYKG